MSKGKVTARKLLTLNKRLEFLGNRIISMTAEGKDTSYDSAELEALHSLLEEREALLASHAKEVEELLEKLKSKS